MPETVGGVPLHPLVVHAVVVLIPLAAVGVIAIALIQRWRDRYGVLTASVAVAAAALVPVATQTGQNLKEVVATSAEVNRHADLGATLVYSAVPLAVLAVLLWWLGARTRHGRQATPRWASTSVAIAGVLVGLAGLVQIVLIGHSGATAAWG